MDVGMSSKIARHNYKKQEQHRTWEAITWLCFDMVTATFVFRVGNVRLGALFVRIFRFLEEPDLQCLGKIWFIIIEVLQSKWGSFIESTLHSFFSTYGSIPSDPWMPWLIGIRFTCFFASQWVWWGPNDSMWVLPVGGTQNPYGIGGQLTISSNKKLLVTKGIATRRKDATNGAHGIATNGAFLLLVTRSY